MVARVDRALEYVTAGRLDIVPPVYLAVGQDVEPHARGVVYVLLAPAAGVVIAGEVRLQAEAFLKTLSLAGAGRGRVRYRIPVGIRGRKFDAERSLPLRHGLVLQIQDRRGVAGDNDALSRADETVLIVVDRYLQQALPDGLRAGVLDADTGGCSAGVIVADVKIGVVESDRVVCFIEDRLERNCVIVVAVETHPIPLYDQSLLVSRSAQCPGD